uniref:Uncharacterized protein n=1 Tax=Physcomitrium patens TaxID=3218 RepID=A0A2K1J3C4_PHYPA|nr:hypothetical protein PHYPA_021873 [Physcomitrium patens]
MHWLESTGPLTEQDLLSFHGVVTITTTLAASDPNLKKCASAKSLFPSIRLALARQISQQRAESFLPWPASNPSIRFWKPASSSTPAYDR